VTLQAKQYTNIRSANCALSVNRTYAFLSEALSFLFAALLLLSSSFLFGDALALRLFLRKFLLKLILRLFFFLSDA